MTTSLSIFYDRILLGEGLTIEFSSKKDLKAFISMQTVYKHRYEKKLIEAGMTEEDSLAVNKVISYEVLSEDTETKSIRARIFLGEKKPRKAMQFTILD